MSSADATALPEYGNLSELRRLFGIPKSTAYELEASGDIRFVRLRKRGNVRGKLLVDFDSVRSFLQKGAQQ